MTTVTVPQAEHYLGKLATGWERLQTLPWWGQCVALWLATMFVLTAVGLVAVRVLDLREGYDPVIGVAPDSIPGIWARWDSPYYIDIANQGYEALPYAMGYFPLYPMLMAGLSRFSGMSLAMAGMLISQVSYLAAILLLYKLARLIRDEHGYAMRCVLYMVLFPSAFFFYAVYAESLSLAFSILAMYVVLRARPHYARAGLALGIASAARPVGWLLNLVPLIEFFRRRKFNLSSLASLGTGLALAVSGIVAFVLYLFLITCSFLAIPEAQSGWLRQWQYPWITLWKSVRLTVAGNDIASDWFLYAINWSDLLFTGSALAFTVVAIRWSWQQRFRWSLSIYLLVSMVFLLAQQGLETVPLWGMTRWVSALFPFYLILGGVTRRRIVQWGMAIGSGSLSMLFMAWWASGRWVG
jgi:Gpi18-like mannosyltransferase